MPIVAGREEGIKMEEGEQYAIETFASTGRAYVHEEGDCSHYMKRYGAPRAELKTKGARELLGLIDKNFGTLAFCRRWIDRLGKDRYLYSLRQLMDAELVDPYPPLCDIPGSYTAQYEHTLILLPSRKEVISRGDDY